MLSLTLIIGMILSTHAQDTVYFQGTTQVNFDLKRSASFWFYTCSPTATHNTTVRTVTGLGKVLFRTNGTGYLIPSAGAVTTTYKYYTTNCGFLERTIIFAVKTNTPPPIVVTPPPTEGGGTGGSGTAIKVMLIGDSNTEGYPAALNGVYRQRLDSLLGSNYDFVGSKQGGNFTDNEHEGWSGKDINNILYDHVVFGNMFTSITPDLILLEIGYNDVNGLNGISPGNDPIATAPQRLDNLVANIQQKCPNATIVVVSLLPIYVTTPNMGTVAKVITYNTAVAQLMQARNTAGQKVYFADIFPKFGQADVSSDGLHETFLGYQKKGDEIRTILRGLGYL